MIHVIRLGSALALLAAVVGLGVAAAQDGGPYLKSAGAAAKAGKTDKTAAEWRKILTTEQFYVLVEHGTERAGTSPLNKEKRAGVFVCAAEPSQVLFKSEDKFDSGTGWPSFTRPAGPDAVTEHTDTSHGMTRVEVRCAKTGFHLGHVFDDGPAPTGKRYCINGVALKFIPKEEAAKTEPAK